VVDTPKPSMAAIIAAIAMAHTQPVPLEPQIPVQVSAEQPATRKNKKINTGFYSKAKFSAMRKRRKLAQASRRRNRRG
jgi:hypothetical protein